MTTVLLLIVTFLKEKSDLKRVDCVQYIVGLFYAKVRDTRLRIEKTLKACKLL